MLQQRQHKIPKEQVALETNQENKQNTIKSSETKNATTTTA